MENYFPRWDINQGIWKIILFHVNIVKEWVNGIGRVSYSALLKKTPSPSFDFFVEKFWVTFPTWNSAKQKREIIFSSRVSSLRNNTATIYSGVSTTHKTLGLMNVQSYFPYPFTRFFCFLEYNLVLYGTRIDPLQPPGTNIIFFRQKSSSKIKMLTCNEISTYVRTRERAKGKKKSTWNIFKNRKRKIKARYRGYLINTLGRGVEVRGKLPTEGISNAEFHKTDEKEKLIQSCSFRHSYQFHVRHLLICRIDLCAWSDVIFTCSCRTILHQLCFCNKFSVKKFEWPLSMCQVLN